MLIKKNLHGLNCGYFVPCLVEYAILYKNHHASVSTNVPNPMMIKQPKEIHDNKHHYVSFDNTGYVVQHSKDESDEKCCQSMIFPI